MILGDSAKAQRVDVITGGVDQIEPGYYDARSCYERICFQLGLPLEPGKLDDRELLTAIRDRLEGRRAVVVVDNLETVEREDDLLRGLRTLASRDVRVVLTTRQVSGLRPFTSQNMVVHLKPLLAPEAVKNLLFWHIQRHQAEFPALGHVHPALDNAAHLARLIERTGGIPLLPQLVVGDVARFSWSYLEQLPQLYGSELLAFLYQARWDELGTLGAEGQLARQLLRWVAAEQYRGDRVSFARLGEWAEGQRARPQLQTTLQLLYERFLVVNHDPEHGNFTVFPSLAEFLERHPP